MLWFCYNLYHRVGRWVRADKFGRWFLPGIRWVRLKLEFTRVLTSHFTQNLLIFEFFATSTLDLTRFELDSSKLADSLDSHFSTRVLLEFQRILQILQILHWKSSKSLQKHYFWPHLCFGRYIFRLFSCFARQRPTKSCEPDFSWSQKFQSLAENSTSLEVSLELSSKQPFSASFSNLETRPHSITSWKSKPRHSTSLTHSITFQTSSLSLSLDIEWKTSLTGFLTTD